MSLPKLKYLHPPSSLVCSKIAAFDKVSTEDLVSSLLPGQPGALKTRPDGTVLDGHHRLAVLAERCVDIDSLPREVLARDEEE